MNTVKDRIQVLLNVYEQEQLIVEIIDIVKAKILSYMQLEEIPKSLEWVLVELSVQRFNRIGSEGMSSENLDGKQITYQDEFNAYTTYFDEYLSKISAKKGYRLF